MGLNWRSKSVISDVGPVSQTVGQHQYSIGATFCVYQDRAGANQSYLFTHHAVTVKLYCSTKTGEISPQLLFGLHIQYNLGSGPPQ